MKKIFLIVIIISLSISVFSKTPELKKIGTFTCGMQPKQVLFSPDNKYIVLPLLGDDGFDIFSVDQKKIIKRINPPNSKNCGFAEGLFIPEKKVFLISQMTTGNVYEYSYPDFKYKRTISTTGTWSKFIAYNSDKQLLAVSNWVSNDISIIDYNTGKCLRKIATKKAPRGIEFIDNGNQIISLAFEGGVIEKFDVNTGKLLNKISIENSAMRHIVMNTDKTKAYISDMYFRSIYEVDIKTFTITKKNKSI